MTIPTDVELVASTTVISSAWCNGINDWVWPAYNAGTLITAAGTVTLPTGTVTLASLTGTETLTNKTLTTPVLGVATATSINKVALTAPATSATLTIADGKTLTSSNTVTLTATDGSTLAIGTGGTLGTAAYTAATAYAQLAGGNSWSGTQTGLAAATCVGLAGSATAALGIKTSTNTVSVSAAAAPTTGQILIATAADTATWQTPTTYGDALVANPLSQFAATTSLQLKNTISDETGSGALVFATSPTLVTPNIGAATATSITGMSTPLTVAQGGTGAAIHTSASVLIGAGTGAVTSVAPGTSGNVLTSNGSAWTSAAPSSGSPYVVAKAIVANTTVSNAHSLGAIPSSFQVTLRCITTEHGYAAGDEVGGINDDGTRRGSLTGFVNATTIGASIAANLYIQNRAVTIGTLVNITPAKWEVVLRAWL